MAMSTATGNLEDKLKADDSAPKCPECDSSKIIADYDRGERFCNDCGVVVDEKMIDAGVPYRLFSDDPAGNQDRMYHGAPATLLRHDKGLQTTIGGRNEMRDSRGKSLPKHMRSEIQRLRHQQNRTRVLSKERGLVHGAQYLTQYASAKGLPHNVTIGAAALLRRAHKNYCHGLRGRRSELIALACLYASCRETGLPRTLDEIADGTPANRRELGRTYKSLVAVLKLRIAPPHAEAYIPRYCSELKLSAAVQTKVFEYLRAFNDRGGIVHGNLTVLLSGMIYIASDKCGEKRTQKEIAEKLNISEVAMRNSYKIASSVLNTT